MSRYETNKVNKQSRREAMATYILNLLDLILTLHWRSIGVEELNPLLQNVPLQIFSKIVIAGLCLLFLASRTELIAKKGIRICLIAYIGVTIWHLFGVVLIYGFLQK